jgi:hypothetical protein
MEAEGESRILTRFEKRDEFVALQSEVLSLDDKPASEEVQEDARRQTNLLRNISNIVRIEAACLSSAHGSSSVRRIPGTVVFARPVLRRVG